MGGGSCDDSRAIVGGPFCGGSEERRRLARKVSWRPAPIFVMDVCDSEDGLRVLELNSFGCSGHYLADLSIVVRAASELASQLW